MFACWPDYCLLCTITWVRTVLNRESLLLVSLIDCEWSLILAMAIVGRMKYARTEFRGDATRREFSALPSCRVASKFRTHACVYFACPTVAIAKIRDYSQSMSLTRILTTWSEVIFWIKYNQTSHTSLIQAIQLLSALLRLLFSKSNQISANL